MQLYPAIDMKNGKCVRLRQGAFKDITVYSEYPEEIAALWQEKGATFLHLVDLDGALAGRSCSKSLSVHSMPRGGRPPVVTKRYGARQGRVPYSLLP